MSTYTYRPPWPDEMERVKAILENAQTGSPWCRPRLWETAAPHRFAGAAIWSPPNEDRPGDPVTASFRFRPRFCDSVIAGELLRDLFREILEADHTSIELSLPVRDPWEKILAGFGMQWVRVTECWVSDSLDSYERVYASAERRAARQPKGWFARKIEESDEDFVMKKCGITAYIEACNLPGLWKNRSLELSSIIQSPDGPAGVLLITRRGMTVVFEYLGGAPEFRKDSALISYLGISHLLRRDQPEPFDQCMCLVDPAKGTASRSLMRRAGARLMWTQHQFSGEIRLEDVV